MLLHLLVESLEQGVVVRLDTVEQRDDLLFVLLRLTVSLQVVLNELDQLDREHLKDWFDGSLLAENLDDYLGDVAC